MSNLMFEIILQTIFIIISVTFDILIFDRISLSARNKKDKTLRHAFFKGFREDKDLKDCKLEDIFN